MANAADSPSCLCFCLCAQVRQSGQSRQQPRHTSAVIDATVQPIPVDAVIIAQPSDLPLLMVAATCNPLTNDMGGRPGQGPFSFSKLSRVMSEFITRASAKTTATWDAGRLQRTGQEVRMRPKPTLRRRDFVPIVAVSHRFSLIGDGLM